VASRPARTFIALAIAGLLSIPGLIVDPAAHAKKTHPLMLLPAVPVQPQLPKVKLPKVKLPKVKLPKVKLPKVEVDATPVTKLVTPATVTPPSTPSTSTAVPSTPPTPASSSPSTIRTGRAAARSGPIRRTAGVSTLRARNTAAGLARRAPARSRAAATGSRHKTARKAAARTPRPHRQPDKGNAVARTVREFVEVVPGSLKAALAALACLSAVLGGGYLLSLARSRRLDRQRGELLQEVGLLQGALLPPVPETLGAVRPSVAYRPADGPAAGGDFYDALELPGGRAGFILGDVSGHGREAISRTAFARYTLRAFLEAGLEPRAALQVAARVVGERLGGEFVTVLLAVHDPLSGSLTWASAGHPAPIVLGPEHFDPVTSASSPPIGMGLESGFRQTTVPFPAGSIACMFTDGLIEARTDGHFLGRHGLEAILAELGEEATATALIELVAAKSSTASDDMAACLFTPTGQAPPGAIRREEIVVAPEDLESGLAARFLEACGVHRVSATAALAEVDELCETHDGAVLAVSYSPRRVVEVNALEEMDEQGIVAASRRVAAH
jgi:Stage II sporulation protein E (SpoIIE)